MVALLALLAAAALPAAHVAWGEFVPQPVRNELALDVAAIFENEESPCGEGQYETTDVFAKERLRLSSEGFSYHPRFLQYRVKLAFALTQEEYSETGAEAVRYNDSGFDYDVRLHLLPEHPYSLRLFAVSVETLLPEYGFADASTTYESLRTVFNYKDKPYFLNLHYIRRANESVTYATDAEDYGGSATYRYRSDTQDSDLPGPEDPSSRSSREHSFEGELINNLYKSLETKYQFLWAAGDSDTGTSSSLANTLSLNYVMTNPWGITFAGVYLGRIDFHSGGTMSVLDEEHGDKALNEPFTTRRERADCESVSVLLVDRHRGDPEAPVTFLSTPAPDDRCEIVVTALPVEYDETVPHDYVISYTHWAGTFETRTEIYGFNLSPQLLDNNLNPYLSYTASRPSVTSGSYPGTLVDTATTTAGVILGNLPLWLQAEYQTSEGESPYDRWYGSISYTDVFAGKLNVRCDLSYASYGGLHDATAYKLKAGLQWRIGKTILTLGVNDYRSTSEYANDPGDPIDRARLRYYLNLERRLL